MFWKRRRGLMEATTVYHPRDDRVIELDTAPRPDVGAPLPALVSDELNLYLAYIASEPDPGWDGTYARVVTPESPGEPIATVTFESPYSHFFGPPNDEAFHGHPLESRGLRPYSISEIVGSSWVHALERMNSVHPNHRPEHFDKYRHFVFAFHDSTFECVAEGFQVRIDRGSMRSALATMVNALRDEASML